MQPIRGLRYNFKRNARASRWAQRISLRDLFSTEPLLDVSDAQREQRFWLTLLFAAVVGYCTIGTSVIAYALLTSDKPMRGWLIFTAIVAIFIAIIAYIQRHRIVTASWCPTLFVVWSFASFSTVALIAIFDGGFTSPLAGLMLLPMLYQATGYSFRQVKYCGFYGVLMYFVMVTFSSGPIVVTTVTVQAMTMGVGWLLALSGAANRDRRHEENRRLQKYLESLAGTDHLTSCANQRSFMQALEKEVERCQRHDLDIALLSVDIDHFKQINDEYGHLAGDEVLRQIGQALRDTARKTDLVGRLGGDELSLLAPESAIPEADALADRLHRRVASLDVPLSITISIGICVQTSGVESANGLLDQADQALYEAKRCGRNQTVIHADDPDPGAPISVTLST